MNLLSAQAETEGGIQVVLPPWGEIFWSALILLFLFIVVGKYALPRIYAMLDEREQSIQDGLHAADKAREEQARAAREREEILHQANAEAHDIRAHAREQAKQIVAKAAEDAQAESQRIIQAGKRQIEADRQAAQISLRTDVGLLATELAEKIVGEQLKDRDLTARVVDRFLDELESDTVGAEQ